MKRHTFVLMIGLAALTIAPALAQQTLPTPAPPRTSPPAAAPAVQPPAPPRRQGQPINVKIDLSINDQRGGSPPVKRTLSIIVADGRGGSVRSQSDVVGVGPVPLNVDVQPELLDNNKIRLQLTLQYDLPAPLEAGREPPRGTVVKTTLRDSVSLVLDNDKPMVAAQSADPIGDRQVTVELKATILR